ncbi:agmatine deiminase family protein [Pseudarthrobacter oxydans]|uniref:agmatine deiminase family protein n=1 Tax=Pseudarthrobacter oxydans TaxID=1671 RepID=UPI001572D682|nr:agmatine deiminase family protein [Pseudarthrobacter oxydans]NSX38952.1 agmatine deiminase family protein [Pseudarthrobacter oxydans]
MSFIYSSPLASLDATATDATATHMPAEWEAHQRTWMAFPPPNDTFGEAGSPTLDRARAAWTKVAQTIAGYEPVTVVADPRDATAAREWLGDGITVLEVPLDDAWLRDSGPTFVHRPDGSLAAVDWIFNGWGAQEWAAWDKDKDVARTVAAESCVTVRSSSLVNEGGGFHVDGQGTVLLTETVQLDPGRNPGATRDSVEAGIHAALGTTKAIWLPRGLTRDYGEFGTRGHVDIVAAFAGAGTILLHRQDNPSHPDYEVYRELRDVLSGEVDAQGRPLRIIDVPAPTALKDEEGFVDWSYINHYVANNVVVLCAFNDPNDAIAAGILERAYPGRTVELVDARDIFAFGGGIHCITQQQPAAGGGAA